jgi:hypothetical protein
LETAGVGVTSVLAGAPVSGQMFAQEGLDMWCDGAHDCPPLKKTSPAAAISANSSDVDSKYQ